MKYRTVGIDDNIETKGSVICLGNFDGVHIGHLKLINKAISIAKDQKLTSIFFTIFPSPKAVLGKREEKYLTDLDKRSLIAKATGIDEVIVLQFNLKVAHLHYSAFINEIIMKYKPKYIVCGKDFNFGYKGEGKIDQLVALGFGNYEVIVVDDVNIDDTKVSTTRIIELLKNRDIAKVTEFLGRNYSINGIVIKGHGNGTKFGFPTANIDTNNYFLPGNGVYAVKVSVDGTIYKGMANIGTHPTIAKLKDELLEVHIFDFNQNIYGKNIFIEFCAFIRDERHFLNLEQLKSQLRTDVDEIKRLHI